MCPGELISGLAPPRGKGLGGLENWIVAKDQVAKQVNLSLHVGTDSQRSGSKNFRIAVAGHSARADLSFIMMSSSESLILAQDER